MDSLEKCHAVIKVEYLTALALNIEVGMVRLYKKSRDTKSVVSYDCRASSYLAGSPGIDGLTRYVEVSEQSCSP